MYIFVPVKASNASPCVHQVFASHSHEKKNGEPTTLTTSVSLSFTAPFIVEAFFIPMASLTFVQVLLQCTASVPLRILLCTLQGFGDSIISPHTDNSAKDLILQPNQQTSLVFELPSTFDHLSECQNLELEVSYQLWESGREALLQTCTSFEDRHLRFCCKLAGQSGLKMPGKPWGRQERQLYGLEMAHPSSAVVGAPLPLLITITRLPSAVEGSAAIVPVLQYEIDADVRLWLVSCRKRASFQLEIPNNTISFCCHLVPVVAGFLPVPRVRLIGVGIQLSVGIVDAGAVRQIHCFPPQSITSECIPIPVSSTP